MTANKKYIDRLGVDIQVGDIVAIGSHRAVRIGKVYAFGATGPLCEPLVAELGCRKGFLGYSYIILKRGNQTLAELEKILAT